jgi:hypothetical protein
MRVHDCCQGSKHVHVRICQASLQQGMIQALPCSVPVHVRCFMQYSLASCCAVTALLLLPAFVSPIAVLNVRCHQ